MILSEIRAQAWKWVSLGLVVLAVTTSLIALKFRGDAAISDTSAKMAIQERDSARQELHDTRETLRVERIRAERLDKVAVQYEQDKLRVQADSDRLVADLRAGTVRLHQRWEAAQATAELSRTAAATGQPDAAERDRQDSASRIIAAGDACDAQVRGLQAVIRADRE